MIIAITGVKQYLVVTLICVSMVANKVYSIFAYATCVSFIGEIY